MTKKDLFDGLNYIDDQIIEEAQPTGESAGYSDEIYVKNHETHHGGKEDKNRKKHKKFARAAKTLPSMAANLLYPPGSSLSPEVLTSFVLPAHNQGVSYAP